MERFEKVLKDGPWTAEEDEKFIRFVRKHGCGTWRDIPKLAGLERCWTSCRSRWMDYLRYHIERTTFSRKESSILRVDWLATANLFSGITDNEIKNLGNTHQHLCNTCLSWKKQGIRQVTHQSFWKNYVKRKLIQMGIDPVTHQNFWDTYLKHNLIKVGIVPETPRNLCITYLKKKLSQGGIDSVTHKYLRNTYLKQKRIQRGIDSVIHRKFSRRRKGNNEIKNFNSFGEGNGFWNPLLIQGDSQGNTTNVRLKFAVAEVVALFQKTEETAPNSVVEGSKSSGVDPNSYQVPLQTTDKRSLNSAQVSAYNDAESELERLPKSDLEINLTTEEKSVYGPREEGLKEIDSLNLWMSEELEDIKESNMQSSSRACWEIVESENEVHDSGIVVQACLDSYMLSPRLSEHQLYNIIDFSPNWAYVSSKVEVLIRGRFLRSRQEAENCQWSCMFGEVEVPAEIVADGCGVLRCHTPSQKVGRVPFYVTCSNRLACSEVREFEYRANLVEDADTTNNYGDVTSESLCMRFGKLLCLSSVGAPNCDPSNLSDIAQLKHKISSLLQEEIDGWDPMLKHTSEEKFSPQEVKEKLLQKQLKEKLQAWLLQKAAEGGNGPSVLDQRGQGVLHFAAALGYDWAIEPTMVAGVNINFRDTNGWTALHWAVYYSRERTVALLMSLGAAPDALSDPTPKYPSGQTPADLASSIGHKGIACYLAESDFNSRPSGNNLNKQDSDVAEIHGAKVVQIGYQQHSTLISNDDLLLKGSSAAVCNTIQALVHIPQVFRVPCLIEEQLQESLLSPVSSQAHELGHYDGPVHAAAIRIQSQFRSWRARKDFLIIQQQNVKIQGTTSIQSVDVASESVMDYTNEFANYKVFKTKEALIQYTREVGRKNDFVIVIKRSDSGNCGQKARITFCCERGGQHRNTTKNKENNKEKQMRNTVTKKCGCPFTLQGYKLDNNDNWTLKVVCGVHNHPIIKSREGRSYAGRLSKEETAVVVNLSKSNVRPKEILARLKDMDVNNIATKKHIYNARQRYKGKEKDESSNDTLE